MRQHFLWIVLFVNLVAFGCATVYIAMRPAEIQAMGPYLGQLYEITFKEQFYAAMEQAAATSAPAKQDTSVAPPKQQPAKTTSATDNSGDTSKPAAKRTPPPKSAGGVVLPEDSAARVDAVYVGPYMQELTNDPPAMALYPFRVTKRTFPEDAPNDIEIELLMLNASGNYWKQAYVILKSTDTTVPPQLFQIQDWRSDALAVFRYRFPKKDLERRLKNLRLVSITGERRGSPLADRMSGERLMLADRLAPAMADEATSEILGSWNKTANAIRTGEFTSDSALPEIAITVPEAALIPQKLDVNLGASVPKREEILAAVKEAHTAGLALQAETLKVVEALNAEGYAYLKSGDGSSKLEEFQKAKANYDRAGMDLMTKIGSGSSADLNATREQFFDMTDKLLLLINNVESSIRTVDPSFTFEQQ